MPQEGTYYVRDVVSSQILRSGAGEVLSHLMIIKQQPRFLFRNIHLYLQVKLPCIQTL